MIQPLCIDIKLFFVEHAPAIASRKFLNGQFEHEFVFCRAKGGVKKCSNSFRPENVQRCFASVEMKCAEQARDAVEVISMEMSDENRMNAASLHAGSHELQLRALTAVEEKHVSFTDQG